MGFCAQPWCTPRAGDRAAGMHGCLPAEMLVASPAALHRHWPQQKGGQQDRGVQLSPTPNLL